MGNIMFHVSGSTATPIRQVSLADAGLREREHLQEWVLNHPEMLGDGLMIVTSECDRWASARGKERDRLDVLALHEDGHLVVAELKRDRAPETIELQALKYAAFCSRFTPESVASEHRFWLESRGRAITEAGAISRLDAHLRTDVGGLANAPIAEPRVVLLASSFAPSTTAVAVWLRDMGVDITLRTIAAFQTNNGPIISTQPLYPTPTVEEFTVSPAMAERRRENIARRSARTDSTASQLAQSRVILAGSVLTIRAAGPDSNRFRRWAKRRQRDRVIWTGAAARPLRWVSPDAAPGATGNFTVTGMVSFLYRLAQAELPAVPADHLILTDGGRSLADLVASISTGGNTVGNQPRPQSNGSETTE